MKKAAEYRLHAQDCRELAAKASRTDQREQLLRMAETWESLALDREMLMQQNADVPALQKPNR